eukprot:COSAG02_NODE_1234_length_13742_cov_47.916954_11_plen_913_part_00
MRNGFIPACTVDTDNRTAAWLAISQSFGLYTALRCCLQETSSQQFEEEFRRDLDPLLFRPPASLLQACVERASELKGLRESGDEKFQHNELEDAVAAYTHALTIAPESAELKQLLAACQALLAGDPQLADNLGVASSMRKQALRVELQRAGELMAEGELTEAVNCYEKAERLAIKADLQQVEAAKKQATVQEANIVKAQELSASEDFDEAIKYWLLVVQAAPRSEEFVERLRLTREAQARTVQLKELWAAADAHMASKEYVKATVTYQEALSIAPENIQLQQDELAAELASARIREMRELQKKGEAAMDAGNPHEALRLFKQALELEPGEETLVMQIQDAIEAELTLAQKEQLKRQGQAEMKAKDYTAAATTFAHAVRIARRDSGLRDMALQAKQLAIDEARFAEMLDLARLQASSYDYHQAVGTFDICLSMHPGNDEVRAERESAARLDEVSSLKAKANSATINGDFEGAIALLKNALALSPDDKTATSLSVLKKKRQANVLQLMGEESLEAGNYEDAVKALLEALDLDPDNDQLREEEQHAEKMAKKSKLRTLALRALKQGEYEHSVEDFTLALKIDSSDAELATLLQQSQDLLDASHREHEGDSLMLAQKYSDAAVAYDQAMQLDPNSDTLKAKLIEAQRRAQLQQLKRVGEDKLNEGDVVAAVDLFRQALLLDPEDSTLKASEQEAETKAEAAVLQQQGEALMASGDYTAAAAAMQKALRLDPLNATLTAEQDEATTRAHALKLKTAGIQCLVSGEQWAEIQCQTKSNDSAADHDNVSTYSQAASHLRRSVQLFDGDAEAQLMLDTATRRLQCMQLVREASVQETIGDYAAAVVAYTTALKALELPKDKALDRAVRVWLAEVQKFKADAEDERAKADMDEKKRAQQVGPDRLLCPKCLFVPHARASFE